MWSYKMFFLVLLFLYTFSDERTKEWRDPARFHFLTDNFDSFWGEVRIELRNEIVSSPFSISYQSSNNGVYLYQSLLRVARTIAIVSNNAPEILTNPGSFDRSRPVIGTFWEINYNFRSLLTLLQESFFTVYRISFIEKSRSDSCQSLN